MHLIVCVAAKKLHVPSNLPKELSRLVAEGGLGSTDEAESTRVAGKQCVTDEGFRPNVEKSVERDGGGDRREAKGVSNAVKQKISKGKRCRKMGRRRAWEHQRRTRERTRRKGTGTSVDRWMRKGHSPPDLKTATRSVRDGVLSAEGFLPIPQVC